ncbi:hypothetical protein ABW20_dc0105172 [Dactylellina cionopaga]|nr:hypothetical protein ABW20_dc0105172 [Dactylellina cionopaga]
MNKQQNEGQQDPSRPAPADGEGQSTQGKPSTLPSANLPKGGGAIHGIGEKFQTNPATGTATMSVPIATSASRDGFNPSLSLSYDSGNGNGPFGFGWSLSLDSITRKTSKGLPRYRDFEESDVFISSGVEDLVPVLRNDGTRHEDKLSVPGYLINRYRPRIDGEFNKTEKWSNIEDPTDIHWRVYSPDDVLTIYGRTKNSRIFDPEAPERVFSWLISDCRDWKGNAIVFNYKVENGQGVDTTLEHEKSRGKVDDPRRTANRYTKSIKYGNTKSFLDNQGERVIFPSDSLLQDAGWLFEVMFDYGEHGDLSPSPTEEVEWSYREDGFSSYRSGFEVRTCRLCRRVLMFHNFEDEPGVGLNCLVKSTDFVYHKPSSVAQNRIYTFLDAVEQSGYRRNPSTINGYIKRSMPPIEFKYSEPSVDDRLKELDPDALKNVPSGLASNKNVWIDLYGEGIPGILSLQKGAWYYKRNITPISGNIGPDGALVNNPMFDFLETVPFVPNGDPKESPNFADLTGDGRFSIINGKGNTGYYGSGGSEIWTPYTPFENAFRGRLDDSSIFTQDITGDGLGDLITTKDSLWYQSLGTRGFASPKTIAVRGDDSENPIDGFRNDILGNVFFADFSGDGLTDIVRVANGQVIFWPNLGYGKFGSQIKMDNAPVFDEYINFDPNRIILADIDGSGTTDMIYMHQDGARVYFNESGNSWSEPIILQSIKNLSFIQKVSAVDLFGNGTTVLLVSSPLPNETNRPMYYVDLMGSKKPHLLTKVENNLGSIIEVKYNTSTKFYLQDKAKGTPWITKLAIPTQVVEAFHTYDRISRNKFTTRFAYHHGYYDGEEREFRGFGMVEQWDTEEFSSGNAQIGAQFTNSDLAYALPPVHSKSWFHLGISVGGELVSRQFEKVYFQALEYTSWNLPDTVLPLTIPADEEHDAIRALKGCILRKEIFLDDASPGSSEEVIKRAKIPINVEEANFTLTRQQVLGPNLSSVYSVTQREIISFHFERDTSNPRINHQMVLESNEFGQTLREIAIGYGRQTADTSLPTKWDQDTQMKSWLTYTINTVTNAIDDVTIYPQSYRLPVNSEMKQYELTGISRDEEIPFTYGQFSDNNFELLEAATEIGYDVEPDLLVVEKRLLKISRTLGRKDDLTGLLPLGKMGVRCIPGQSYALAFTSKIFDDAYQKDNTPLFPARDAMLTSKDGNGGGFFSSSQLKSSQLFPSSDPYDGYWMADNLSFYSMVDNPTQELLDARANFYRPVRSYNTFGAQSSVTYDKYNLLILGTLNPQGNVATIGERDGSGNLTNNGNDYRILQPILITDANGNRVEVTCDTLGSVVGSAVMGKSGQNLGDNLTDFIQDLDPDIVLAHIADPIPNAKQVLQGASTRIMYDLFAYQRTKNTDSPQPAVAYSLSRTSVHEADIQDPTKPIEIRHTYDYSDGFGRVIQSKTQTKPGPVVKRDPNGHIIVDPVQGQPILTDTPSDPRWIASGWTIYNNKGMTVAKYEPYFTHLHEYEFEIRAGVSVILFYDALGRPLASLHPNSSYVKSKFSQWMIENWDQNDTIELDPRTDEDLSQYTIPYFQDKPNFQTWLQLRMNKPLGDLDLEAAEKTKPHANTPTISYVDALGRIYLTAALNKVALLDHDLDGTERRQYQRVEFDVEGKALVMRDSNIDDGDALGRINSTYKYDMLGRAITRSSMESGTRIWFMNALNQPLYEWNDRGYRIATVYDKSGRQLYTSVLGDMNSPEGPDQEVLTKYTIFGEHHPQAAELNLVGKVYLSADQAGITINTLRDFKGNLVRSSKRFNREYKTTVGWNILTNVIPLDMEPTAIFDENTLKSRLNDNLQDEAFSDNIVYDSQNRITLLISPNSDGKPSQTRMTYLMECLVKVEANIRAATDPAGSPQWKTFINGLDYDARGLRSYVDYGNGIRTTYSYNNTGELLRLLSTRQNSRGETEALQDLTYTYDPSFRHTNISDAAQQTVYFRNQVVEPTNSYTYDALYQLIRATGREHLGQDGGSPIPYGWDDSIRSGPQPGDEKAMSRYIEDYVYDNCGNIKKMRHASSDPSAQGHSWTRIFSHEESSLLQPGKKSNRLTSTNVGSMTENYSYDAHGNMTRMPHLGGTPNAQNMFWDFLDQTRRVDLGGGGTAYYIYDGSGERVRKVIERSDNLVQERIYLNGGLELFRVHQNSVLKLERETLHIVDDRNRVALIETRTADSDSTDRAPEQVQRYQLSSHLGSSTVELDDQGKILTYEEYSPYGSSTYSAVESSLELPKRYRFTGKERDGETGLEYHGMRYYCPWLARWTSCDPAGGSNNYEYCSSNPILWADPTGASEELDPIYWLKDIVKGREAEAMVVQQYINDGVKIEKEVWIAGHYKEFIEDGKAVVRWVGKKRLDIIGEDFMEQVKWVGVKAEQGVLDVTPQLKARIEAGFADIADEVKKVAAHAEGKRLGGWKGNPRAQALWGKGGKPSKSILKFVVDGEKKVLDQFRAVAEATKADLVAAGKFVPTAVEVVAGTGSHWRDLLKPVAKIGGIALAGALGALSIGTAGYALATASNWKDRGLALLDLTSSVLSVIPVTSVIGIGLGLAITAGKLGVAAYNNRNAKPDGPQTRPPEEPASPTPPAGEPPSKTPDAVPAAPEPEPELQVSPASTPAAAPKSHRSHSRSHSSGGGGRLLQKWLLPGNTGTSKVSDSFLKRYKREHGGK